MAITKPFVAKHGLAIANTTHIVFNSDGSIHANNAGIIDSSTSVTNTAFQSALANTNLAIADRMQVANTIALVDDRIQVANLNATLADYWPSANVITYVDTEVAALVNSAPSTLNTLNELAAALGDDENFATTVTTNLGQKLGATASVTLTGDVTGSGSFSSNSLSISVTVDDSFASNANLQTEVSRIDLVNTNLTGTNTALRTLIDDRMQVANVTSTYVTNTTFQSALANTNAYIATKTDDSTALSTNTALRTLISDRIQVANVTSTYVTNTTFQSALANTNAYITSVTRANTSTTSGSFTSSNNTITFTREDSSSFDVVLTGVGEVTNSYVTSTYVTNTDFQSYVANTNARFTANTSVANATFESTNNTITFTRQDSSVFDVVLTGITGSGGSANTEDISNQKFKTKQTGTEITYTVTVGTKTANSPWQAGSSSAYFIDGEEVPTLTLVPGFTYKFDQADATNASHPIAFYREADKSTSYPFGVSSTGTAGSTGAYTTIEVSANTPMTLFYQCQNHGYMGGQIATLSDTSPKYAEQANVTSTLEDYWPSANVIAYIATNAGGVTNTAFNAYIANTEPRISSLENNSLTLTAITVNTLEAQGGGSLTYNDTNGQFNFRPSSALPTVSNSAPTLSGNGALWFDEDEASLFIEYDGYWVEAAPVVGSSPNNFVSFAGNNTLRLITASGEHIDADLAQLGGGGGASGTAESLTGSSRTYTANGTATIFAAAYTRDNPEDVFVTIDGVDQRPTTDYTLTGANVVFGTAPPSGTTVMIRTFVGLLGTNTASFDLNSYTANGTQTTFFSPSEEAELDDLLITINGVVQRPTTDYTYSAQTVTFTTAPVNSSTVAIRTIRSRIAQVTEQYNTTYTFANNTSISAGSVDQNIKIATYTANGSATSFAANTNSITLEKSIVAINGILQRPTTDYTMVGNNVVFGSAPANNDVVSIREFNTSGQVINKNLLTWEEVTSNTNLSSGVGYFVDSTAGPIQVTLPAPATMGNYVKIIDAVGKSSNNNITVNSNGSKIMGDASDMTVSTNRAAFTLVYYNSTQGWLLSEV
jgi:hypothetical protein